MKLIHSLLACALLSGCSQFGAPRDPIPTIKVAGTQTQPRALVAVLPGFIYDADDLYDHGVADAIHRGWPEVDVVLVGATYPYYRTGVLAKRLHEQVFEPARRQGYRELWLAGGSMGGMGVLLYEWAHPGELSGLVLFSPFLGSDALLEEIRAAGGTANWDAGPLPAEMDGDNYQRQVWKMIKGWARRPEWTRRVWLACGTEDYFASRDVPVLAAELPPEQSLMRPGGHDWDFWLSAMPEVFGRISSAAAP